MSPYSTAITAMEHDTARRLEALDPASHDRLARRLSDIRLDHGRLVRDHSMLIAAAADAGLADGADESDAQQQQSGAPLPARHGAAHGAADPAREALEKTCLTVKRIAHDIGMPRATLEAYRLGTRRMPHSARVRLGTYLAAHAAMLDGLAQALMAPPTAADL